MEFGFAASGCPFLPRASSGLFPEDDREVLGLTDGSSNCPAGVNRRPPSGLKVRRRKKFVKPSSPYNLTLFQVEGEGMAVRMAGNAGSGDGERA
jgi:hypothetical protein